MAKKAAKPVSEIVKDFLPADANVQSGPGIILQLDPNTILADDNTRFNLKESRIMSLAESILSQGGVIEPIEVEPLAESNNGFTHRLTLGFYRHAAVKYLNTTQAAGLTIPAVLHVTANPTERLKRQLAENIERENQSPMDSAIAIKRLFDAGLSRMDVRQMFSRPGTRKGAKGKPEPASNAFVNMMLSFLELPKTVQEKIHQGVVGVAAAYQLTKVDKDKQAQILEQAEEERQRQLEREEKDEEKFLTQEKKAQESQEKLQTVKIALDAAESKAKQANETLEQKTNLTAELFKTAKGKHNTPKDKKAAESAFKELERQRVIAEADATEAQKEYEKAQVAYDKLTDVKQVKAKKVAEERAKKAQVKAGDVTKAAKQAGAAQGAVPLTGAEMRKVVIELALPGGDPKVIAIGKAFESCFAGVTTPKQLYKELEKAVN